jgi:hypothetical protein
MPNKVLLWPRLFGGCVAIPYRKAEKAYGKGTGTDRNSKGGGWGIGRFNALAGHRSFDFGEAWYYGGTRNH